MREGGLDAPLFSHDADKQAWLLGQAEELRSGELKRATARLGREEAKLQKLQTQLERDQRALDGHKK